jgi:uncharacterized protein
MGANSIMRYAVYALSDKGSGVIFDRDVWPIAKVTYEGYNANGTTHSSDSAINHFFEKGLKLPAYMMTDVGKKEALKRQKIMIDFLRQFFIEENAFEWIEYLDNYLRAL